MDHLTLFNLRQRYDQIDESSSTLKEQRDVEALVRKACYEKLSIWKDLALRLFRDRHKLYVRTGLTGFTSSFQKLDASQTWIAYWAVHAMRLLNCTLLKREEDGLIAFLKSCQHPDGGFGGGPKQLAHLAPTYGAVNCLVSLCRTDALDVIDRVRLVDWLTLMHLPNGAFTMHTGGEIDVRGAYCAASVAKLTGILQTHPHIFDSTADWIASCQTYEGGFGGKPGLEAHGGYTFCSLAALCLLGRTELIDLPRLLRWTTHRQMASEGGFQGRTNKLVDSCYSFWVGGTMAIVEELLWTSRDPDLRSESLWNISALQVSHTRAGLSIPITVKQQFEHNAKEKIAQLDTDYQSPDELANQNEAGQLDKKMLTSDSQTMSQEVDGDVEEDEMNLAAEEEEEDMVESGCVSQADGGLVDKPGKSPDLYHTCYALSGLSIAQHSPRFATLPGSPTCLSSLPPRQRAEADATPSDNTNGAIGPRLGRGVPVPPVEVAGMEHANTLLDVDPLHNVVHDGLTMALVYFATLDAGQSVSEAAQAAETALSRTRTAVASSNGQAAVVVELVKTLAGVT